MTDFDILHATCVCRSGQAVLLTGPSGSGKSDLALRLITDHGFALLADDRTPVRRIGDTVWADPPDRLHGVMEVRGIGIVPATRLQADSCPVRLVVDLVSEDAEIDRMPLDPPTTDLFGLPLMLLPLRPFEPSAVHKVALALGLATGDISRSMPKA